ncbi:unnamed protein product [Acanthoscelides obtectus]|uniref:Uncharacterized protein n=1 Tax=Acanthoscelides obtectus TaxID=200917 RepID=A0A9P0M2Z6_ACAOB|nr:unnamed protein product [Acanthoscelides obtectus]CAK1655768.1 hypothetical protein AOBTE_LOCUS19318 [Acanthoscelides obtectus]
MPEGRYKMRRIGKSLITKADKEQQRNWPTDWSMPMNMEELLEDLENEVNVESDFALRLPVIESKL